MDRAIELPTSHTIPVSWIKANACPAIQWRTVRDLLPKGSATEADIASLKESAESYKPVQQLFKKQRDNGLWSTNLLGTEPNKALGVKEPGTIARYRRLLELGIQPDARPFRLTNRVLYRVLSRDPDPDLLFEYQKTAKGNLVFSDWARELLREGAVAALVQGGQRSDPRVRGAAKRMADNTSAFLRSTLSADPLIKSGSKWALHPDANPPTLFTFAMMAYMPYFRRERAGLVERLAAWVSNPQPDVNYIINLDGTSVKPTVQILGDPISVDSYGRPKDIPFVLHFIELLARNGILDAVEPAKRALVALLDECDESGVWSPKGLRGIPKSPSTLGDFAFPLEFESKNPEHRKADVTFRLALIAKLRKAKLSHLS